MKVSIIMPVYNASATMDRALASVGAQTFRDFELVCVHDYGADDSEEKLKSFADTADFPVRIISHSENRGAAAARNTGLDVAEGEYVAFVDADDEMAPDALEKAMEAAEGGADIVGWDWMLAMSKDERYMRQADYSTPLEALKNFMAGVMRWNLWLFVSRRSLWNDNAIRFLPGMNMGEDMMVMHKLFCCAGNVALIHEPLYHYNAVNSSSISKQFSESNRMQVSANVDEVQRYIVTSKYSGELGSCLDFLKLNIKLPLLVSGSKDDYRVWRNWYSEANGRVMENKAQPLRTRLLQKSAKDGMWPLVYMYYILVEKIVYGVIYR